MYVHSFTAPNVHFELLNLFSPNTQDLILEEDVTDPSGKKMEQVLRHLDNVEFDNRHDRERRGTALKLGDTLMKTAIHRQKGDVTVVLHKLLQNDALDAALVR